MSYVSGVMETTTQSKTDTCSQCNHWKATSAAEGQCRRNPPQAVSFKVDDEVKFETRFPVTAADDWCGEFTAK